MLCEYMFALSSIKKRRLHALKSKMVLQSDIVGNHSIFFRYTSYVPWVIWQAKSRFHEYAWGRWDQSSSNEIMILYLK